LLVLGKNAKARDPSDEKRQGRKEGEVGVDRKEPGEKFEKPIQLTREEYANIRVEGEHAIVKSQRRTQARERRCSQHDAQLGSRWLHPLKGGVEET